MAVGADQRPAEADNVAVLAFGGTDAELLERVRSGDQTVAAAVYDRYGDDVNRVIWRCLGADAEHDDIVHEAFIQILQGLHRVQDAGSLRGWVVSVAINTARSELRRRRFRRRFWSPDEAPEVGVDDADPHSREVLQRVYAILDRMPTDERIAFILRFVEQYALAEVADLVGCSLATIKRRLAKATKRFGKLARHDEGLVERLAHAKWGGSR